MLPSSAEPHSVRSAVPSKMVNDAEVLAPVAQIAEPYCPGPLAVLSAMVVNSIDRSVSG